MHPLHVADLLKSGLSDQTIREAGLYSVPPSDFKLPPYLNSVTSMLAFPYPKTKEFERYKIFPIKGNMKYFQRPSTGIHLYFTPNFDLEAKKIYATEGEKKALRMYQAGYPTIGLGGVWSFACPEWRIIKAKEIVYIPDSDVWQRPDLKKAVRSFADYLICYFGITLKVKKLKKVRHG